jgi:hyperosmotically inducible protein
MHRLRWLPATAAFFLIYSLGSLQAQEQPVKPDNTRQNKDGGQTADQQKMSKADREIAAQARKALVDDKSLSTYAHNAKILVQDGTVTLRGPVRSEEEKTAVEAKVKTVDGVTSVNNELMIASK